MKVINNTFYNETIYTKKLNNGLTVYLMPRKQFSNFSAVFATDYGSFDYEFMDLSNNTLVKTPQGVAHFLEHKMFDEEDGTDISDKLIEIGIDSNAYTSYDITAYFVSGNQNIEKAVLTLLDFVQKPNITDETVESEKEIICQELMMYKENPLSNTRINHLKLLYGDNDRVIQDIGGTIESVNEINKETLLKCYDIFYHPSNMCLSVVGNFDPNEMLTLIESNQNKKVFKTATNIKHLSDEYYEVLESIDKVEYLNIKTPIAVIGFKFPYLELDNMTSARYGYALDFLFDAYFGEYSNITERLREIKVNVPLNYAITYTKGYGYFRASVTTNKYEDVLNLVKTIINEIIENGISEEQLKLMKRSTYTSHIKRFNNNETLAEDLVSIHKKKRNLFDSLELCNNVTINDVLEVINIIKNRAICTYVAKPKE